MAQPSPYPEIPDHVWQNIGLKHELEAEYTTRPQQFRRKQEYARVRGHASRMRFGPGAAAVYWAEHADALAKLNCPPPPPKPPKPRRTWRDAQKEAAFDDGRSLVEPWQHVGRTVLHGGGSQ